MAKHWRMLLLSGFSDCSCAKCAVDRGRPVTKRNLLERTNLPLEGYFRALYVPLGGLRTRMKNAFLKSMKLCVSMFSNKPPCMPLCFDTSENILPKAVGAFSSFLASAATTFSFFSLCGNGFFFSFFFLLSLLLPLLFLLLFLLFLRLSLLS